MEFIQIENQITLMKCKELAINNLLTGARVVQMEYLKAQFQNAGVNATALAVITVTEGLGFSDLAIEMKSKLSHKK